MIMMALLLLAVPSDAKKKAKKQALWPNGEVISEWFMDTTRVDVSTLGRQYVITDYEVVQDSTKLQTEAIQKVIDRAAQDGGGVVVFPRERSSAAPFSSVRAPICIWPRARY